MKYRKAAMCYMQNESDEQYFFGTLQCIYFIVVFHHIAFKIDSKHDFSHLSTHNSPLLIDFFDKKVNILIHFVWEKTD